ncbi:MAG: hypothetical protein QM689_13200 [Oscillospiraceae bacterium]
MKKKWKLRKFLTIFLLVVLVLDIGALFGISFVFKNPQVTPSAFGYSFYITRDGNTGGAQKHALVAAKNGVVAAEDVGKVVLCEELVAADGSKYAGIFRLKAVDSTTATIFYTVSTDASADTITLKPRQVVGVAQHYFNSVGKILAFADTQAGILVFAGVPVAVFALVQVLFSLSKKQKKRGAPAQDVPDTDEIRLAPVAETPRKAPKPQPEKPSPSLEEFLRGGFASDRAIDQKEITDIRAQYADKINFSAKTAPVAPVVRTKLTPPPAAPDAPVRMAETDPSAARAAQPKAPVQIPAAQERTAEIPAQAPRKGASPSVSDIDAMMAQLKNLSPAKASAPVPEKPAQAAPVQAAPVVKKSAPIYIVEHDKSKPSVFDATPAKNYGVPKDSFDSHAAKLAKSRSDALAELMKLMETEESNLRKRIGD